MDKNETSLFDGIDFSLVALARFAGNNPPSELTSGLAAIADAATRAQRAFAAGNDAGTAGPVEEGLTAVRSLRSRLGSIGLSADARYEIDFRLKTKERDYENAVLAAHGLTFDAVADDGLVIGGQAVKLNLIAVNRGASEVNVTSVAIAGFDGAGACKAERHQKGRLLHLHRRRACPPGRAPHDALFFRRVLEASGQSRDQYLRTRRRVRRSLPSDTVPRRRFT